MNPQNNTHAKERIFEAHSIISNCIRNQRFTLEQLQRIDSILKDEVKYLSRPEVYTLSHLESINLHLKDLLEL